MKRPPTFPLVSKILENISKKEADELLDPERTSWRCGDQWVPKKVFGRFHLNPSADCADIDLIHTIMDGLHRIQQGADVHAVGPRSRPLGLFTAE